MLRTEEANAAGNSKIRLHKQMRTKEEPSRGRHCTTAATHNIISESESMKPVLVHKGKSTSIYRLQNDDGGDENSGTDTDGGSISKATGFKVIEDLDPTEDQILRLLAEEQISRFLPRCCAKRKVIQVKSFRGNPALHFEWIDGVSLKEWLSSQKDNGSSTDIDTLKERLKIATAITKTLCGFHKGCVAHHQLSADHIILEVIDDDDKDCYYDASLINVSRAIITSELSLEEADEARKKDLRDLGHLLNVLFSGSGETSFPSLEDSERSTTSDESGNFSDDISDAGPKNKRGKRQCVGEGLPLYIKSLISTLIESSSEITEAYDNAESVWEDLKTAEKKPDIFLKLNSQHLATTLVDSDSYQHRLQIPSDAFYGRESEVFRLLQSFHIVNQLNGQPALTCVSGYGGSGKTSLVRQIKGPLNDARGYFIRGKFNFDTSARPDSVLTGAFDDFFGDIIDNKDKGEISSMKARIQETVGSGCRVLMESIPNLAKMLGQDDDIIDTPDGKEPLDQWKFLLCKLIRAIAHKSHPIVFFMDDLQWADQTSLDSIQMMATDPDVRYVHYLACYRDDEDDAKIRVIAIIDDIDTQGVNVTQIKLGPIDTESINTLVSENLYMPPSLCRSLSRIAHNKTGGIIFFVTNYLKTLNEDGLLRYNLTLGKWEWNTEQIRRNPVNEDGITHYLTQQMTRLNPKTQLALKIAACFGFVINAATLQSALLGLDINVRILDDIVEIGFLQKLSNQYQWAHDQVHSAAYELISEAKRKSFHLLIGSKLLISTTSSGHLETAVYDIVRHMNIGAELMKLKQQKLEVAYLNLLAGKRAISSFSFHSAAKYLVAAISLHGEDDSDEQEGYDFLMEVYDLSLKPLFAIGDFLMLEATIHKILALSKSFEERLNAYCYLTRLLAASCRYEEAIAKVMHVLEQLGEALPTQITKEAICREMREVQTKLATYSELEILSLPNMSDGRKLLAMQFLNEVLSIAFLSKPILLPILVFRMVKLSIDYGLCVMSSIAFCGYGALLVSPPTESFDAGYRMGKIGIAIMEKLETDKMMHRLYFTVYSSISVWKEPFQAGLEKLLQASDKAAIVGDSEYKMASLSTYSSLALWACGSDLSKQKYELQTFIRRGLQHKHDMVTKCLLIQYSLVLQLMNTQQDCYSTYEYFQCSEDDLLLETHDKTGYGTCRLLCNKKAFMAMFSRDMVTAAQWLKARHKYPRGMNPRFIGAIYVEFMEGLVALYFARQQDNNAQNCIALGEGVIETMKKWAASSDWNYSNKLHLLEAEYFFLKNDEAMAIEKYDMAIEAAHDHRFIHEEGLANTLAANFHLYYKRKKEALRHFNRAKSCYEYWGAMALVNITEDEIKKKT